MIKHGGRVINISAFLALICSRISTDLYGGKGWIFLILDSGGTALLLLSLVVQKTLGILCMCNYIAVLGAEAVVYGSYIIWIYRERHILRPAKLAGLSYDAFTKPVLEESQEERKVSTTKAMEAGWSPTNSLKSIQNPPLQVRRDRCNCPLPFPSPMAKDFSEGKSMQDDEDGFTHSDYCEIRF